MEKGGRAPQMPLVPGGTTNVTPRRTALSAAWHKTQFASGQNQPPNSLQPRLKLATNAPRRTAWSSPWITDVGVPNPAAVSTLMLIKSACGAIPRNTTSLLATVPATCVACGPTTVIGSPG